MTSSSRIKADRDHISQLPVNRDQTGQNQAFQSPAGPATLLAKQVQWRHPTLVNSNIDQTQLAISDAPTDGTAFSFIVMGDTDAGALNAAANTAANKTAPSNSTFSHAFAQQLMAQVGDSRFLLHTGDVTYPMGTYQNYRSGFLEPYQALLARRLKGPNYNSRSVIFNRPVLPVPGNHDYADLRGFARTRQRFLRAACDRLRQFFNLDFGHYGGHGGEAYGQTFLDTLVTLSPEQLKHHLSAHYSALAQWPQQNTQALTPPLPTDDNPAYCLNYQPSEFTRLPNRYYRFRYGGVDFFALDSNTWNTASDHKDFDHEQLAWLEKSLIASWQTPGTVGRILYLHHSPYTTESTRWQQAETLWVRRHLRSVLDRVQAACAHCPPTAPLVDIVISGHAHCLEHVRTTDTGHADAHLDWIVCGGSGLSLRQQRNAETPDILEKLSARSSHTPYSYDCQRLCSQRLCR
ncbi:MAG: metallophosphoesterase [Cyanobacteria bacterium J06598_3]